MTSNCSDVIKTVHNMFITGLLVRFDNDKQVRIAEQALLHLSAQFWAAYLAACNIKASIGPNTDLKCLSVLGRSSNRLRKFYVHPQRCTADIIEDHKKYQQEENDVDQWNDVRAT